MSFSTSLGQFTLFNTSNATQNFFESCQTVCGGDVVTYSNCQARNGSHTGDTYLQLVESSAANGVTFLDKNDNFCGRGSEISYTGLATMGCNSVCIWAGCRDDSSCFQDLQIDFQSNNNGDDSTYNLSSAGGDHIFTTQLKDTNFGQVNFHEECYSVCDSEEIIFSSCSNCDTEGDTFFRLFSEGGTEIASNDDGCGADSLKSELRWTVPAPLTTTEDSCQKVCIRVGCSGNSECKAHVEVIRNSNFPVTTPALSDTDSASRNTFKVCHMGCKGENITFDSCTGPQTDIDMRLFDDSGQFLLYDDMSCVSEKGISGFNAYINYAVEKDGCHQYCVDVGCFVDNSCNGVVNFHSALTNASKPVMPVVCSKPDSDNDGGKRENTDDMGLCGLVHATNIHNVENSWSCTGAKPNSPPCGDRTKDLPPWKGIECNEAGRVKEISWQFTKHFVEGHIPKSIQYLDRVHHIDFHHQRLRRSIPEEISKLSVLKTLDLSTNLLGGKVPKVVKELKDRGVKVNIASNDFEK